MFDAGHDNRIVQRGIDEALACQDMLARAPIKPSWVSRMVAWTVAAARSIEWTPSGKQSPRLRAIPNSNETT